MRVPQVATARFFKCPKCNGLIPASDTGHPDSVEDGGAGGGEHALAGKISDPLLQLFRQSGKVAAEHLEEALAVKTEQGGKLYEILIRLGHLKAEDLHALLSRQPGIAAVHLANIAMDRENVKLLPSEVVLRNFSFPIDRLGKLMTAAMVCPLDMEAIAEIQNHTGLSVKPVLCSLDDFYTVVEKYYHIKRNAEAAAGGPPPPGSVAAGSGAVAAAAQPQAAAAPVQQKQDAEAPPPEPEEAAPPQETPPPPPVEEETPSIIDRIEQVDRLEIAPRVATQISSLVGYGKEGLRKMADMAPWSPPLVATLVSAANSSAYGLPGMVDNLALATALLGDQGVGLICSNMREANPQSEKLLSVVSRHSRQTGNVAALLAQACGRSVPG
ncbi:MAG TPA: HDOD domain-containing protein, partial [Candidatus Hydrogenedentes bacterium]|nr:HDOD domain-containing protein [Candidatus Hydrogenedentota bacterium]